MPEVPSRQAEAQERSAVEEQGENQQAQWPHAYQLTVGLLSREAAEQGTERTGQGAGGQCGDTEDQGDEQKDGNPSIEWQGQPLDGLKIFRPQHLEPTGPS